MTDRLQRLADMAIGIASAEAVVEEAIGFTLNVFDTALNFFETHGDTGAFYCRAVIGRFGNDGCPCEFAEDALKGNFFWRGTEGATLSLNENDNAVYLTDRFDKDAFDDEAAFAEYINAFLRSVYDWQARLDGYVATKEASR